MSHGFSNDLRVRVIGAISEGLPTAKQQRVLALVFERRAPGTAAIMERPRRASGTKPPRSKLYTHEAFILGLVDDRPDISLVEIAEQLL